MIFSSLEKKKCKCQRMIFPDRQKRNEIRFKTKINQQL
jgi:hypothetical protein